MIAQLFMVRLQGVTKSHALGRNSYEDITTGIEDLLTFANGSCSIICVDRTQAVISSTVVLAQDDEDGRERALNEIAEALEEVGHEVTF